MQLVKTTRDTLLRPLQIVSGIVERRHTMPILANILIRKDGESVSFLSTDTEVDQANFEVLKSFTSHCIHLVTQDGWTEVTSGYFWLEQDDA